MHYIKKIYVLLLTGSIVSITGCSAIQYGTEDLPKSTFQKNTEDSEYIISFSGAFIEFVDKINEV